MALPSAARTSAARPAAPTVIPIASWLDFSATAAGAAPIQSIVAGTKVNRTPGVILRIARGGSPSKTSGATSLS